MKNYGSKFNPFLGAVILGVTVPIAAYAIGFFAILIWYVLIYFRDNGDCSANACCCSAYGSVKRFFQNENIPHFVINGNFFDSVFYH